jgi:two-component SAPR family response regulator
MPGITGVELSKYVKEARPELIFVMMSAMPVQKEEWRNIIPFAKYMDDFIPKPFSLEELVDVIERIERKLETSQRN